MSLVRFNALWVGPRLDYLERLCIASAQAAGHPFTLWSYDPDTLQGVPPGVELRDAAEVMPREGLDIYQQRGMVALFADLWRIELLAKGLGCWVDMDLIFLKPFQDSDGYIFGWEYENWINNAILLAPQGSAMVADLKAIPQPNRCMPWYGPRSRLKFYWRRFREGRIELEDYPWGTFSSGLITYVVKKNGLTAHAQKPDVFYPVRWKDARALYAPAAEVEAMIGPDTRAVHLWHSRLQGLRDAPPPPGSYIDWACRHFGVDPTEG